MARRPVRGDPRLEFHPRSPLAAASGWDSLRDQRASYL